jgi:uncharacterized damage-inducible protein DinB
MSRKLAIQPVLSPKYASSTGPPSAPLLLDLKAHAFSSLYLARRLTRSMLEDFNTLHDWFYQAHASANHALWIVGHLGLADNAFASKFRPMRGNQPEGWKELFWSGSQPLSTPELYPPIDEVLAYFDDRRETLLQVLKEMSSEELSSPAPPAEAQSPIAGAPNIGQVFFFIAYHEGLHCGQLSVARRGLGHVPVFQAKPLAPVD